MTIDVMSDVALVRFPIKEAEYLQAYIARSGRLSTVNGGRRLQALVGKPDYNNSWAFPSRLTSTKEVFGHALPHLEEVLSKHTHFRLYRPFIPSDAAHLLESHYLFHPVPGIAGITGISGAGAVYRWRFGICFTCIDEASNASLPYWKTGHMVPGLSFCPYHQESLRHFCLRCSGRVRDLKNTWLMEKKCDCGGPLKASKEWHNPVSVLVQRELSFAIRQILEGYLDEDFNSSNILRFVAEYASNRAWTLGASIREVVENVRAMLGAEVCEHYGLGGGRRGTVWKGLTGRQLSRNPIKAVLLIIGLFGSLNVFVQYAKSRLFNCPTAHMPVSFPVRKSLLPRRSRGPRVRWPLITEEELAILRALYRQEVTDALADNPDLSRALLLAGKGRKAANFLNKFDCAWFAEKLPSRSTKGSRGKIERGIELMKETDARIALLVYENLQRLVDSREELRITRHLLLLHTPFESYSATKLAAYPNVVKALDTCVEQRAEWLLRTALVARRKICEKSDVELYESEFELVEMSESLLAKARGRMLAWLRKRHE